MELWIRSQNKGGLIKAEILGNNNGIIHAYSGDNQITLGEYDSSERAVEVLDEIQSKLKATFLMKMKDEMYSKYIKVGKKYLENLNGISIVTGDACFDLEPISKDIYVYEMPEK